MSPRCDEPRAAAGRRRATPGAAAQVSMDVVRVNAWLGMRGTGGGSNGGLWNGENESRFVGKVAMWVIQR